MRFNVIFVSVILLAGAVHAAPAQEIFSGQKFAILSRPISIIEDYAFVVGRAKSSSRGGDDVGYSKAALFAYSNLDCLNYERANWPSGVTEEEKTAAWHAYRNMNPFTLTVEGGQRIYYEKPQPGQYLIVMAFPADLVLQPPVEARVLAAIIENIRLDKMTPDCVDAKKSSLNPVRGATIKPLSPSASITIEENVDEDLIF